MVSKPSEDSHKRNCNSLKVDLEECDVRYYRNAFNSAESRIHLENLKKLNWEQRSILMIGKACKENRFTCSFSLNEGISSVYKGSKTVVAVFPKEVLEIKKRVEEVLDNKYTFNYCCLNYYKSGDHSIGMHDDIEKGLEFPIASVSFGDPRKFKLKHKTNGKTEVITLADGSLLTMDLNSQKFYKHGLDKEKDKGPRINLTFRIKNWEDKAFKKQQEKAMNGTFVDNNGNLIRPNKCENEPDTVKKIKLSATDYTTASSSSFSISKTESPS